jgi:hypothetical protein
MNRELSDDLNGVIGFCGGVFPMSCPFCGTSHTANDSQYTIICSCGAAGTLFVDDKGKVSEGWVEQRHAARMFNQDRFSDLPHTN